MIQIPRRISCRRISKWMFAIVLAAVAAAAAAAPAALWAQAAPAAPSPANPDSALADALGRIGGAPLTLERALVEAAEGATDARIAKAALDAARAGVRRESGGFDPELFGDWNHQRSAAPTGSFLAGADVLRNDQISSTVGARWLSPIGTQLSASLNTIRLETNNSFASLDPQYNSTGQITLRQPLLKGFGPSASASLKASERDLEAARARYDDALLGVRASVETAYWQLYAAARTYATQMLIRDRARSILDETLLREKAGLVGPGDTAGARLFLAQQEQALLDQEEMLDAASDAVANLIGRRPEGDAVRFRAMDEPPDNFPPPDEDALVEAAQRGNLQLQAAERGVASLRAREKGASLDALPQVDLYGTLGGTGLSGTGQEIILGFTTPPDTIPGVSLGGAGKSVDQVFKRQYPDWTVGVSVTVPLGARRDRGIRDVLRAQVRQAEQGVEAQRRALDAQVRQVCRDLAHGRARLAAAGTGVAAAQEQVRIGVLEYHAGRTTTFELVRLGADLASAQQSYSQALVRAARAAAQLRQLTANAYPGKEAGS